MIPPRPQVHIAALLQLAGKAEDRHGAALHAAPWIVGDHALRHASGADRAAHAAERVGDVPGAHAAGERGQAVRAIQIIRARGGGEALQHLGKRRGQILGGARGDAAGSVGDQRAIAVGGAFAASI